MEAYQIFLPNYSLFWVVVLILFLSKLNSLGYSNCSQYLISLPLPYPLSLQNFTICGTQEFELETDYLVHSIKEGEKVSPNYKILVYSNISFSNPCNFYNFAQSLSCSEITAACQPANDKC